LMKQTAETQELFSVNPIRVETVLSRFPVHRISKRGNIQIEINERGGAGELVTKWEVSHNTKYGQPGALAYKVDTLIVNRRIDEAPRPVPEIRKLGSLKEIGDELGLADSGKNRNDIRRALHQNAGAYITAKRAYKGADGVERTAEISDTRYGIVFTGEKFPDGSRADAVYLILHRAYREIINTAPIRPLDYDYLAGLSPGAQRFYELLSYQIYAALKNERPRAKLLYSFYCARAPQTRYLDYDHVKKQMYKLHAPHKKSGYISAVELRETRDVDGRPDWEMVYTPGRKARAEFRAFRRTTRTAGVSAPARPLARVTRPELPAAPQPEAAGGLSPEFEALVAELVRHKVSEDKARELVMRKPESVGLQLRAIPYLPEGQGKKNFAGRLVKAIENDYELPWALVEAIEKEHRAKQSKERQVKAENCPYCRELSGWRYVKGHGGPVRRCTHDPAREGAAGAR
jgi:hypothetical protein